MQLGPKVLHAVNLLEGARAFRRPTEKIGEHIQSLILSSKSRLGQHHNVCARYESLPRGFVVDLGVENVNHCEKKSLIYAHRSAL